MDIDSDKALAALEQLEAEKTRRFKARVDSGELVSTQTVVVVHRGEDAEEATARAIARHPIPDDHHRELFFIFTGVPRDPDFGQWVPPQIQTASPSGPDHPDEEPAARGPPISCAPPTYIFTTTRQATKDGDPGQIAEALWSVDEEGCVALTNREGRHIGGRALLKDEDPAAVARALLREAEEPKDFQRPIHYPKLGLA